YRAWGNVLEVVQEEVPAILPSDEIGEAQPVRFQGQYYDDESGLHYNRFRYYDPDIGRFVSIDPIGFFGGTNLYQYSLNPVNWVDPLGWSPCKGNESISPTSTGILVETGNGSIYYGAMDPLGRPTGVSASITGDMIKTGTPANPNISPRAGLETVQNSTKLVGICSEINLAVQVMLQKIWLRCSKTGLIVRSCADMRGRFEQL
ncbi:MAG: RHS repeat-associated core domain-containing protein, partial [Massilia sp.]